MDHEFFDRIKKIILASDGNRDEGRIAEVERYFEDLEVAPPGTIRHYNDELFMFYADKIDSLLSPRGYIGNVLAGSVSWTMGGIVIWKWCFQREYFLFGFRRTEARFFPKLKDKQLLTKCFPMIGQQFVGVRTERPDIEDILGEGE